MDSYNHIMVVPCFSRVKKVDSTFINLRIRRDRILNFSNHFGNTASKQKHEDELCLLLGSKLNFFTLKAPDEVLSSQGQYSCP